MVKKIKAKIKRILIIIGFVSVRNKGPVAQLVRAVDSYTSVTYGSNVIWKNRMNCWKAKSH